MSRMHNVPCLKCGTVPEPSYPAHLAENDGGPDELINQPYKATSFTTHGHYGSTFFDPGDGSTLEINICDPCLAVAEEQGRIIEHSTPIRQRPIIKSRIGRSEP